MVQNKRKDQKRLKREKIVEAALKVFAAMGFNNSKISDIAKEAGIADGTIYIYFKKKDDIIIALFEEKMALFNSFIEKSIEGIKDPIKKLSNFISTHLKLLFENRDLAGLFTVELRQSSKFMKDYKNISFKSYINILKNIILDGQKKGIFRDDIRSATLWKIIFGTLDQVSLSWIVQDKKIEVDLDKLTKEIIDFTISGICKEDR